MVERNGAPATSDDRVAKPQLPTGFAVTASGRISGAAEPSRATLHYPFRIKDLVTLDNALKYGSRAAKARLAVYIGDLGDNPARRAREILARVPTPNNAVLLAVDPNRRCAEVVYGAGVRGRGGETAAPLAVAAATSAFKMSDDLMDGLISAVRVLSAAISPSDGPVLTKL
ncbi:DUF5130 family protein [Mycobacterium hubeiense]|uniref:DUF5130 family protein n=1 Tax=Mycobacterium hubeiense TaxID=1867256 RepID=UPI000C7F5BCD|nr:DUF5130 family protein [Mycobacterium sp. QGD 101]